MLFRLCHYTVLQITPPFPPLTRRNIPPSGINYHSVPLFSMFMPRCCRTLKGLPDPPTGAVKMSGVEKSQPGRDRNGRGLKQYHPASAFRIREGERKEKKSAGSRTGIAAIE